VNSAPQFMPYPSIKPPAYSRWLASGAGVLVVAGVVSVLLRPWVEPLWVVVGTGFGLFVLLLLMLIQVLYLRLKQHNAHCYTQTSAQVSHAWWANHRQTVALAEAVLVSPACTTRLHAQRLFSANYQPLVPVATPKGPAIRLLQVQGDEVSERERHLAIQLVLHWQEQRAAHAIPQPTRCYWQGSQAAWQAFVDQMALSFPQVQLPERPEPWAGIRSLHSIIDHLQGTAVDARVLCAGCQSSSPRGGSDLPAGEASVLWLLGAQGEVLFSRGEWFDVDDESLTAVTQRALQQSELPKPAQVCVSFSPAQDVGACDWSPQKKMQDAHFGDLQGLQAMVAQTLAAWYVEQHQVPCAWMAKDPHHTLALGVVKPNVAN